MSAIEPIEAEVVEHGALAPFVARPEMTPAEVRATVEWQAELLRAVLEENVDYGVIRGTPKPSLWKPGAEKLLRAFGFGHHMEPLGGIIERDADGQRVGVTYRCVVTKPMGDRDVIVATCEGYCGYDDKSRRSSDPWNTIVKMAQKRALVGATLPATSTSGLLTQDLEDYPEDDRPGASTTPPPRQPATVGGVPVCAACGGSLAGTKVRVQGGQRFHDSCPKSADGEEGRQEPREEGARATDDAPGVGDHQADAGAGAPAEATPDTPLMNSRQRGKLFALLAERGIKGDTERRAWAAKEFGLPGAVSFTTLTRDQARRLVDALERGE